MIYDPTRQPRRQGDILLAPVHPPEGVTHVRRSGPRGHVLALGERTGHAHLFDGDAPVSLHDVGSDLLVRLDEPAELRHDKGGSDTGEHSTLTVPAGWWRVVRQREYTTEGDRMVMD